jgi:photosystem II stability/assembly factor-like uncharacterized protein
MRHACHRYATVLFLALPLLGFAALGQAPSAKSMAALRWRYVGPQGNRIASVTGVPGDVLTVYIGAADGGVWKTTDGGTNWAPVFDKENVGAIGALAVAPSAHNIVWAGTGEPWLIRPFYQVGDGVYRSDDAGKTWRHMGLEKTGHIARVVIDPHNPNRVFVCAIGQTFRPQQERGIFRTLDGGKTWKQVLFVNRNTGCSSLAMDASNPNTLLAGMWEVSIHTWDLDSGGTAGGVYISHDGGDSWHKIAGHGLPAANHAVGKVAVGIARSNPERAYALIEDTTPGFYRSDDGGAHWTLMNRLHVSDERAPYYTNFTIAPDNQNLLYFPSVSFSVSMDAGKTLIQPSFGFFPGGRGRGGIGNYTGQGSPGGDNHEVWIDPTDANHILVANDSGLSISLNHGVTYQHLVLPIAQVYHATADNAIPYHVMGNLQDKSSFRGPSRSLGGRGITLADWQSTGGCEDGFATPDPKDANIVWSGCDNGRIDRIDFRTGMVRDVTAWPVTGLGWAPKNMQYRWHWSFPIAISPFDHNRVYAGAQVVFETDNAGQSWKVISPDLTTNDRAHEGSSGGIVHDNLVTYNAATLYAIAESPVQQGEIWTGSNDGLVYLTRDGGAHWSKVSQNIAGLPKWGTVWAIAPSPFDAGTAYVSYNFQGLGDYNAYVYETQDYGQTWKLITGSIPKSMNSSTRAIVADPVRKGMLYLATDNAVYVTWNDGRSWTSIRNNMPPAPVHWLALQPHFSDLIAGTYGRGVWILDDVTALRNLDQAQGKAAYLFAPRPAYRFRQTGDGRETATPPYLMGTNPPYGADLNFWLGAPERKVTITIHGADGKTIRTLHTVGHAGLNRVYWDLRYASGLAPQFQVSPPGEPWVDPHRRFGAYGIRVPAAGPIVVPGTYTATLQAAGLTLTAPVAVLADPHSPGTPASIAAQVAFLLQVRGELDTTAKTINSLEWIRKQTEDLEAVLGAHRAANASVIAAARGFEAKTEALEGKLIDIHNTGRSEDAFRNPMQLYGRMAWLISELDGNPGGGSIGGDLGPTDQQAAVNDQFRQELAGLEGQYQTFQRADLAAFNALLRQHQLTGIVAGQ